MLYVNKCPDSIVIGRFNVPKYRGTSNLLSACCCCCIVAVRKWIVDSSWFDVEATFDEWMARSGFQNTSPPPFLDSGLQKTLQKQVNGKWVFLLFLDEWSYGGSKVEKKSLQTNIGWVILWVSSILHSMFRWIYWSQLLLCLMRRQSTVNQRDLVLGWMADGHQKIWGDQ